MLCCVARGVVPRVCRAETPTTACSQDRSLPGFATARILCYVCKLPGKYSPLCGVHTEICECSQARVSSGSAPCRSTTVDGSLDQDRRIQRTQLSLGSKTS